jgi:MYXO-CTERM domain-containing protein
LLQDACRTTCVEAACGDGTTDSSEECDEGFDNDDEAGDACRTDCTAPFCGDGVVDSGEECDDADGNDDDTAGACSSECVTNADGTPGLDGAVSGGGCKCNSTSSAPSPMWLFGIGALVALRRRRRG